MAKGMDTGRNEEMRTKIQSSKGERLGKDLSCEQMYEGHSKILRQLAGLKRKVPG